MASVKFLKSKIINPKSQKDPVVKTDFKTQLKSFFNIFFAFLTVGGDLA